MEARPLWSCGITGEEQAEHGSHGHLYWHPVRAHLTLLVPLTCLLPGHLMAVVIATTKRKYVKNKSMDPYEAEAVQVLDCPGDGGAAWHSPSETCLVSFLFL